MKEKCVIKQNCPRSPFIGAVFSNKKLLLCNFPANVYNSLMKFSKNKISKFFLSLFLFVFANSLFLFAEDYHSKTIKVGYYENEIFQEGARPGAVKTGYAYEYYQKLSEHTGDRKSVV